MAADTTPVPEPPGLPIIGNIGSLDRTFPLGSMLSLSDTYGEIYRLHMPAFSLVVTSTHELVNELCDEKRFKKIPEGVLAQVRNGVHDGLFTAKLEEPNWAIAHRVLMPAFGPMGIRGMFDEMHDIASQLVMKWARQGSKKPIAVTDDFTRLALDTLSLCSMGFRFNSFYSEDLHPFVEAMGDFLVESGNRSKRPPLPSFFYRSQEAKYQEDIRVLRETAETVLKERVSGEGSDRKDLLTAMLNGRDSQTGLKMTDQSIIDNLITFLIAGHETTSGMLSYAMYQLLKHPEQYRKVQQEVDEVVGKGPVTVQHVQKLPYIAAVLRETLRLSAPIPAIAVQPIEDTLLAGKYQVRKGEQLIMLLAKSQLDPTVFEDPTSFNAERMLDENFNQLPKNAWKPFGNGVRGCIGRPFAWQEAILIMALMFQNFNFVMDDPNYNLHHKQTLTIKPKDFQIRALLREGLNPTMLEHRLSGTAAVAEKTDSSEKVKAESTEGSRPITILYGSNSGTCESMAQRLASDAASHGFKASTLDCLDVANGKLPEDQPVVIITASYEGQPPDNAAHFVSWIESIKSDSALKGVSYAVFGCGHHDWAQTFHRIPKLVDGKLAAAGAKRIAPMGLSDAAGDDMFSVFETWEDEILWPALKKEYGDAAASKESPAQTVSSFKVNVTSPRSTLLRQDVREAEVVSSRVLTAKGEPVKKHIEIRLPSDMTYRAGDYLAILPINPRETIQRVMRRFDLAWDANLDIEGDGLTTLPTNVSIPAQSLFGGYVELAQPATKRNILSLTEATDDDKDKAELKKLATEAYADEISAKRISILDLLERYPSIKLPLHAFLTMLPPMRVRQYSISSSPLSNSSIVSITFSLLLEASRSGKGEHIGVASSYLDSLQPGDKLHAAVRPSHSAFHLPQDPEQTPLICVAAGTGLAPFRGFIQERAAMISAGRKVAPAVVYYGCREPGKDDLYTDELSKWEKMGAVKVRHAFSRTPEKADGNKYVQDALWSDREYLASLWDSDARLYVCGSRRVGQGVDDVAIRIGQERAANKGIQWTEEDGPKWWSGLRNVRYATDVFD